MYRVDFVWFSGMTKPLSSARVALTIFLVGTFSCGSHAAESLRCTGVRRHDGELVGLCLMTQYRAEEPPSGWF